jgi:hypothetical protein
MMSLILFAPLGFAQNEDQTQAQQDGLAGAVKSVSTVVEMSGVPRQQLAGPTLVIPLWCRDCEYSPDGYRTRSGEVENGKFIGEVLNLNRDARGRVTDVLVSDPASGDLFRHEVLGPFGVTEQSFYEGGRLTTQNLLRYDRFGHLTDWISLDATGAQVGHTQTRWTSDGEWTERTSWGKDQKVQFRHTYDPAKGELHYTTFDETGNVNLTWILAKGRVVSFWEPSNSTGQAGDSFVDLTDKANPNAFSCHNNGQCEMSCVHYEYADAAQRSPASAEWRDASGKLLDGAYFSYQFDPSGNWTHREVSVWNTDLAARTLYETDNRLITYWDK